MELSSWKIEELMTQLNSQMMAIKETLNQISDGLEKQKTENEKRYHEQLKEIKEEQRKWNEEKAMIEKLASSASPIVNLNVGGERMSTLRATLTLDADSLLAKWFSGSWDEKLPKDKDGYIFLDYDPELFKCLLNQLRHWSHPSAELVLRSPVKHKESFLELVRKLEFNERYIESGKSIVSSATTVVEPKEEIEQSARRETNTATSTTTAMEPQQKTEESISEETNNINNATTAAQPQQQVEQPTDDGKITDTSTATAMEPQQKTEESIGDETNNINNATTAAQPQQQVEQPTDDGKITDTSTATATESQQKAKQSIDNETNTTTNADKVSKLEQEVERFQTTYSTCIQLTDDNRKCEKISKNGEYQSVLGTLTYSSGVHKIRLKVEKHSIDIFFGICSQTKLPTGTYLYDRPTVHGWLLHGYKVINGQHPELVRFQVSENDILELTINCDQKSLRILNETNREEGSMQVDINQAPFPWCLLVLVHFKGGRLSLV